MAGTTCLGRERESLGHWGLGVMDWYPGGDRERVFLFLSSSCHCPCPGEGTVGRQVPLYLGILAAAFSAAIWLLKTGMWCPEEERK